jgi:hypothetical protein
VTFSVLTSYKDRRAVFVFSFLIAKPPKFDSIASSQSTKKSIRNRIQRATEVFQQISHILYTHAQPVPKSGGGGGGCKNQVKSELESTIKLTIKSNT